MFVLFLSLSALIRTGRVLPAGYLFPAGSWLMVALVAATAGGVRAPFYGMYILIILGAALFVRWRIAVRFAALTMLTGLGMVHLASLGVIYPPLATPATAWLTQSAIMIFVSAQAYVMTHNVSRALTYARREIAERKRVETALRASEERYQAFITLSADGIYRNEFDPSIDVALPIDDQIDLALRTGYVAECNDALAAQYGFAKADELIGVRRQEVAYAGVPQADEINRQFVRNGYRIADAEFEVVDKSGRRRAFAVSASGVVDNGRLVRTWNVQRDITEKRQVQEALQRYAERLKILHEINQAILAAQSIEAIVRAALSRVQRLIPNRRAAVILFDRETNEATAVAVAIDGQLAPDSMQFPLNEFEVADALLRGQAHVVNDLRLLEAPSPVEQRMLARGLAAYLDVPLMVQGELIGAFGLESNQANAFSEELIEIVREVANQLAIAIQDARLFEQTQRHAQELELHAATLSQALEQQRELDRLQREFIQNVSHELRTPLTGASSFDSINAIRRWSWKCPITASVFRRSI